MNKHVSTVLAIMMAFSMVFIIPQTAFANKYERKNGPYPDSDQYTVNLTVWYELDKSTGQYKKGGEIFDGKNVISSADFDGVSYNKKTNTLTLDNFQNPDCEIAGIMMGDDFTIEVKGDCEVGSIEMRGSEYVGDKGQPAYWGGSLNIDGTGTLTVNKAKGTAWGIFLWGDGSDARLNISESVSLNVYGNDSVTPETAVFISSSVGELDSDAITVGSKPLNSVYPKYVVTGFGHEQDPENEYAAGWKDYWVESLEIIIKGTGTKAKTENPMTVKGKTAVVKYSSLKKAKQTLSRGKVLAIGKSKGTLIFTKKSGSKKISINKRTGKVTISKGLGKGTYPVTVTVKDSGDSTYKAKTKTVTFKVRVK